MVDTQEIVPIEEQILILPGTPVDPEELKDMFQAAEGMVQLIYGRIRQGKSTEAVRRMYESLTNGRVVYSNLRLDLSSVIFDDRLDITILGRSLLSQERRFYHFEKANYHWFDPTTGMCDGKRVFDPKKKGDEIRWLNNLTDCEIFYDEGQWLLDSYEKTDASVEKRKFITETGHMNRLIVIIAQRTQSVHVNARGNVNQFFRCQKIRKFLFFRAFLIEEFQDMKGTDVDEDAEPVSRSTYYVNKKYWELFNTHYLRNGRPTSQQVHFKAFDLTFKQRASLFLRHLSETVFFLKKEDGFAARSAREIFPGRPPDMDDGLASLGVEPESATLKSGERLNTVPAGGNSFPVSRKIDWAKVRREKEARAKREAFEKDQEALPF